MLHVHCPIYLAWTLVLKELAGLHNINKLKHFSSGLVKLHISVATYQCRYIHVSKLWIKYGIDYADSYFDDLFQIVDVNLTSEGKTKIEVGMTLPFTYQVGLLSAKLNSKLFFVFQLFSY